MKAKTSRRKFLASGAAAGVGTWFAARTSWAAGNAPSDRVRVASIGCGGRGGGVLWDVAHVVKTENIAALCDVDDQRAGDAYKNDAFKHCPRYRDFREMLQKEEDNIDAVTIGTPDHTHAPAAVMAMRMGKHVYVEKPLTYTVKEARVLRELAAEKKLATQMGNQGTAGGRLREGVEIVQAGLLGEVREVHTWTNRPVWPQGLDAIFNRHSGVKKALHGKIEGGEISAKVPDALSWNLWLGPSPERPYDPIYLPFNWRGWLDWGTGSLGDMACHTMNLPYMALKLDAPVSVEAEVSCLNPETYPEWGKVTYRFPEVGGRPAIMWYWYDGNEWSPKHFAERMRNSPNKVLGKSPAEVFGSIKPSGSGSLIVGDKGMLYSTDDYGNDWRLLPEEAFKDLKKPEPTLPRSPGHAAEWIHAIRGGPKAMSNFDYAGRLTEFILLGNVAMRMQSRIEWDSQNFKITNNDKANQLLHREYRKGWTL
ncbi:MAG TPA: Gfo/Idh/MocA family oxidoreductase [Planctomycetota bacterium]|jgi:predicted dehydrogenase|nr:Gfo/Idh/MocA family oxidoreductase [Planctomycetota bacterium]OQC18896.1 MAG: Glycosyl hydrolase family 109 protein 1 precursor [Planctomycetes bacterium ADurb.Bin069]HNR99581.1 Gfo/Idh/MocA family oxidoreductase [Planctomycetota bacterium]HNU26483.1 Gfo/Idh/MocA family oxidoreductase [Planctomycetota bacterium]HOE28395.1 Gfo/Idh/MocA family oxidoreductase [Planctomycetota bacterium]